MARQKVLRGLVEEIVAFEPTTPIGIGIYARAVLAANKTIPSSERHLSHGEQLGGVLAAALIRIEEGRS